MSAVLSLDSSWPTMMWNEHEDICSTIADGDHEGAEQLARAHVQGASKSLLEQLKLMSNHDQDIVSQRVVSKGEVI